MNKQNNAPHFDISAAVIRQLGQELITDEVTAIMELVKNSYDADADWIKIDISTKEYLALKGLHYPNEKPGYIIIEDNGDGMSEEDIRTKWMKISLSAKKQFKLDNHVTTKGRTPLGEKGVGRLSTQKLGNRLELITGQTKVTTGCHIAFDWNQFDNDTPLSSVPVFFDVRTKVSNYKGTTLVISSLNDAKRWEGEAWDKFRGQISQMIFPFKEKRVFNVYLKLNGNSIDLDELNEKVRNNAVAKYEFEVIEQKLVVKGEVKLAKLIGSNKKDDELFYQTKILPDSGLDFYNFLIDSKNNKSRFISDLKYSGKKGLFYSFTREFELDKIASIAWLIDEKNNTTEIAHPGNFNGEIDEFYFKDSDAIERAFDTLSEFKRIVQNQVGVRIFRDGFGIKPYGIEGYDWLGLSEGQTSGSSFYGLRPGNIIGYVSIKAKDNSNLKEKTDREGFTDSPYSRNFFRIMNVVVETINDLLQSTRRSYSDYRSNAAKDSVGIRDIKDSFDKLQKASEKAKDTIKKTGEVKTRLLNVANQIKLISKNTKAQENIENKKAFDEAALLLEDTQRLFQEVEAILADTKKLDEHVNFLQPQIQGLEEQLSAFAELAGLGLTSEALSHELTNIVDRLVDETERINKKAKLKDGLNASDVSIYIEYIKSVIRSFRKQLSHLAPSLKYVRENKDIISVKDLLDEIHGFYQERFKDSIQIKTNIIGANFLLKMNKGKLIQIFDNLILNSQYWVIERRKGDIKYNAIITIEVKEPFITIYDNGFGIEPFIQDRIFQPFVTTKPKKIGRGLGLFIVQQLLETSGCEIMLLNEKNKFGNRYIFQLNMSQVID